MSTFTQEAADEVARRYAMAWAEVGYPGQDVFAEVSADGRVEVFTFAWVDLPPEICWRARETVRHNGPVCWSCWSTKSDDLYVKCLALSRFAEDCGVDRGQG